jgi:hypothetical protein
MLCGSTHPAGGSSALLSPEMRRHEQRRIRRRGVRRNPLDIVFGADDEDDESTLRWNLPPLPSSSAQPQLAYALGLLLYEIFATGGAPNPADDEEPRDRRPRRLPIELPLAVRQLLQWTWEWEREVVQHKGTRRRPKKGQQQQEPPGRRAERGERRPSVQDVMWLCFWMGHERTRIDDAKDGHALSLRTFGPHLVDSLAEKEGGEERRDEEGKEEAEEGMDEETRSNLMSLFAETERNVTEKAVLLRGVKKEQKREQFWQLSHSDLFSDSDDDDYDSSGDDTDEEEAGDNPNLGARLQTSYLYKKYSFLT